MFNYRDLFLLILFLLPIYTLNALAWHLIIYSLGFKIDFLKSFRIWVFSNCGRFLPGAIWQYAGRIYLSSKAGISKTVALTSLVLEAVLVVMVSSTTALMSVLLVPLPEHFGRLRNLLSVVVLIAWGIFLLILFFLSNDKIVNLATGLFRKIITRGYKLEKIKINKIFIPLTIFIFFLQFLFGGIVLFFLSRFAVSLPFVQLPVFVGIYSASWLLGYLTVVAPAGLGVQEASLAGLLSFYMPFPIASVVAIALRISLIASELFSLLLNILISKKRR